MKAIEKNSVFHDSCADCARVTLEVPDKLPNSDNSGTLPSLSSLDPGTRFGRLRTLRVVQGFWREKNEPGVSGSMIRRQLIQSQLNRFLLSWFLTNVPNPVGRRPV